MADPRAAGSPDAAGRRSGEELSPARAEVVPRQAATVVLLRGGDRALELLLVRRTPHARFMAGVWVFPGGAVDALEGEGDAAHRRAAVRELEEEASVAGVEPGALVRFSRWITPRAVSVPYSRWITPKQVAVRFDTHFFLAHAPHDARPAVDGEECVDFGWFTPAGALEAHARGALPLVLPTIKHLEQFAAFTSAGQLVEHARGREVAAILPRLVCDGEVARLLLPGEPGY